MIFWILNEYFMLFWKPSDMQISNDQLLLSDTFDQPYRKYRTNHGGGLLVYLNLDLAHARRADLDFFFVKNQYG